MHLHVSDFTDYRFQVKVKAMSFTEGLAAKPMQFTGSLRAVRRFTRGFFRSYGMPPDLALIAMTRTSNHVYYQEVESEHWHIDVTLTVL